MASLVFLVLGSLAQRVKIPDLPSCEGLILSNCYVIPCKSLICFRFSRVVVPWFTKTHSLFWVFSIKGKGSQKYGKMELFSIRPLSIILYNAKLSDHLQGALRLSLICFRCRVVVSWFKKTTLYLFFFLQGKDQKNT